MIGSYNSLNYRRGFFHRRDQKKSLREQYEAGVRAFHFKVYRDEESLLRVMNGRGSLGWEEFLELVERELGNTRVTFIFEYGDTYTFWERMLLGYKWFQFLWVQRVWKNHFCMVDGYYRVALVDKRNTRWDESREAIVLKRFI